METETKASTVALVEPDEWSRRFDAVATLRIGDPAVARTIDLTRGELEAIVQAAYDAHGIVATPAYAAEAVKRTDAVMAAIRSHQRGTEFAGEHVRTTRAVACFDGDL